MYQAGLDFNTSVPKGEEERQAGNGFTPLPSTFWIFQVFNKQVSMTTSYCHIFPLLAFHTVNTITKQHPEILTTATNSSEGRSVLSALH